MNSGDIFEKDGIKYKVTDKHPRLVIDAGRKVILDPEYKGKPTFSHVPDQYLLVVPLKDYDEFMKNYDMQINVNDEESIKRLRDKSGILHDEYGDYILFDGEKVRI